MNVGDKVRFTGKINNLPISHIGKNDVSKILNYGIGRIKEINVFDKKTLTLVQFDGCVFQDTLVSNKYLHVVEPFNDNKKDNTI